MTEERVDYTKKLDGIIGEPIARRILRRGTGIGARLHVRWRARGGTAARCCLPPEGGMGWSASAPQGRLRLEALFRRAGKRPRP